MASKLKDIEVLSGETKTLTFPITGLASGHTYKAVLNVRPKFGSATVMFSASSSDSGSPLSVKTTYLEFNYTETVNNIFTDLSITSAYYDLFLIDETALSSERIYYGNVYVTGDLVEITPVRGPKGDTGEDGSEVLTGYSPPVNGLGKIGDLFVNLSSMTIYGPKTDVGWGSGRSMVNTVEYIEVTSASGIAIADLETCLDHVISLNVVEDTSFTLNASTALPVQYATMIVSNSGTFTLNWPSSIHWPSGLPYTPLPGTKDVYSLVTISGGTTWNICSIQRDVR